MPGTRSAPGRLNTRLRGPTKALLTTIAIVLVACGGSSSNSARSTTTTSTSGVVLTLDPNKNYGDEHADGILPVV
jgi:hypothetical protein